MNSLYFGIDVAGAKNTWLCILYENNGKLFLNQLPQKQKLIEIIREVKHNNDSLIKAACIDAQLTWSIMNDDSSDTGFRESEKYLKELIPKMYQFNIASQNSLMAVPVRGRQLAEYLRVYIPTIIETHPTINLILSNIFKNETENMILNYKKDHINNYQYFECICAHFCIGHSFTESKIHDGMIDSLICSITAYLVINRSDMTKNLTIICDTKHTDLRGYAPFFVFK